jgi:polyisoprenyl-phosphate glycosyltransferase
VIKKLISVIIPAYNESDCVDELAARLVSLFDSENSYEWEAIIVENGSTDNTWSLLADIHETDPGLKVIRLARNFGMDGGLTAGLEYARGEACVFMTADLQDPPEMISEFLRMWEEGYENVYGVLTKREGAGRLRTFNSKAFYWLASKLTDGDLPPVSEPERLLVPVCCGASFA